MFVYTKGILYYVDRPDGRGTHMVPSRAVLPNMLLLSRQGGICTYSVRAWWCIRARALMKHQGTIGAHSATTQVCAMIDCGRGGRGR